VSRRRLGLITGPGRRNHHRAEGNIAPSKGPFSSINACHAQFEPHIKGRAGLIGYTRSLSENLLIAGLLTLVVPVSRPSHHADRSSPVQVFGQALNERRRPPITCQSRNNPLDLSTERQPMRQENPRFQFGIRRVLVLGIACALIAAAARSLRAPAGAQLVIALVVMSLTAYVVLVLPFRYLRVRRGANESKRLRAELAAMVLEAKRKIEDASSSDKSRPPNESPPAP
jgi:hypothetical protein